VPREYSGDEACVARELLGLDHVVNLECSDTRWVDAFALALIKLERQQRKLTMRLVYSHPAFNDGNDFKEIDAALLEDTGIYRAELASMFDQLSMKSLEQLLGDCHYSQGLRWIKKAETLRGKVFHGQRLGSHDKDKLSTLTSALRQWIIDLGSACHQYLGYSGCSDSWPINSTDRVPIDHLRHPHRFKVSGDFKSFLKECSRRKPKRTRTPNAAVTS
jgi:hypothetical protein